MSIYFDYRDYGAMKRRIKAEHDGEWTEEMEQAFQDGIAELQDRDYDDREYERLFGDNN